MSDISCAMYSVRTALGGKATAAYVSALLNYSCRNFAHRGERKRLASPPKFRAPPAPAACWDTGSHHWALVYIVNITLCRSFGERSYR